MRLEEAMVDIGPVKNGNSRQFSWHEIVSGVSERLEIQTHPNNPPTTNPEVHKCERQNMGFVLALGLAMARLRLKISLWLVF